MRVRNQRGHLRCMKRQNGDFCWELLWRETEPSGQRIHHTAVIGTVDQYPTEELAQKAVVWQIIIWRQQMVAVHNHLSQHLVQPEIFDVMKQSPPAASLC
jgi:hypothetical protein